MPQRSETTVQSTRDMTTKALRHQGEKVRSAFFRRVPFLRPPFVSLGVLVSWWFASLLFGAVAAQEAPLSLSLQEALSIAAKNSYDVKIEKIGLESAEYGLKASYGIYDLNLSANWSINLQRDPATSILQAGVGNSVFMQRSDTYGLGLSQFTPWGQQFSLTANETRSRTNSSYYLFNPTYSSYASLSTSLPLLKGFGIKNNHLPVLKAKLDKELAGFQYARDLRDTLLSVEQAYWDLVYARENLDVSRSGLELARQFQSETAAKIKAGVLAPVEQITADAQVAQNEQNIVVAESDVRNREDLLKLAMGYSQESKEWNQRVVPSDDPKRNPGDYDEASLIKQAEQQRPEIAVIAKTLEKNKLDTAFAKNQRLPSLTLQGGLSYAGTAGDYYDPFLNIYVSKGFSDAWSQVSGMDYKSWNVGLVFSYPIQNRAARFNYQNVRLAQNSTEIQLEKEKLVVANDVRLALRNLQTTEKRIAAAELNVKLQQEKLDAEKKKFENGLSTAFNVLSYQDSLISAKSALLKARIDNQEASASLDRAVGTYLASKGLEMAGTGSGEAKP